ncbi:hypothetical protein ACFLVK_00485 [Chloroflexota bacterium]
MFLFCFLFSRLDLMRAAMTGDSQLLWELARLINRYGPERFAQLASLLRNPEEARNLAAVLEAAVAGHSPTKKRKGQGTRTLPGQRILEGLRKSEPDKYEFLVSFRNAMVAHKILPSLRHLRRFADEDGIALGSATSREKAIIPLLRFMAILPLVQVQTMVHKSANDDTGDRTLARWSDVIMANRLRPEDKTNHLL